MQKIEDYIGDGVYVTFDGYAITLDLRGQDNTTRIVLEPQVMQNLKDFEARMGPAWKIKYGED